MAKTVKGNSMYTPYLENKGTASTIKFLEVVRKSYGVYHIYMIFPVWGQPFYGVIFGDQVDLLAYVKANEEHLFRVRLLKDNSSMHSYGVELSNGNVITALTIAQAHVLVRKPKSEG